ncbi:TPR repeat-containing protein [Tolypothrix tenuis PCC 7101]|uniref:TPR repeat-containing protein n=1 Tax=Tolypothrix tenuis PCC 7101 TaxID=231146 RepID=A0A1Z4MWV0_9CYAN|nr:tetratricopeptide repeat protein [Aulosira sp. FACHB-113]BAY97944.1 TPR repeat-containing protein [Tolypothrix tenuis PCC 7101]BAZ71549.1 TPR repeat-containing protein [Aulosira laxa NIES-50]
MTLNNQLKTVCVQPLSYLTLSMITTIISAPSVLAVTWQNSFHSPEQSAERLTPQPNINITEPKIAQLQQDSLLQERSQFIQQANAQYSQGDFKGAEESLRKFIKRFPEDAFGHYQLGNVLFRQEKLEEAITSYQETIRLKPKYALAYNAIGIVYASQSRWDEAMSEYRKALEINSDYADALTNLALALWQTNKRDEALTSLKKAINIFKSQNRKEKASQVEQILQKIQNSDNPGVS